MSFKQRFTTLLLAVQIIFIFLICSLFSWTVQGQDHEEKVIRDIHDIQIIKSEERPHDILYEACYACHPKEKFKFWLLIYGKKEPKIVIDKKPSPPILAGKQREERKEQNLSSHQNMGCNFCHFENPTEKEPRFILNVNDLCKLCHPATPLHHIPSNAKIVESVKKFIKEGKIPGQNGDFSCLTCHEIHDSVYSMRVDYAKITSIDEVPNPHGSKLYCMKCHSGKIEKNEPVRFVSGSNLEGLCLDCHDKPGMPNSPHVWGVNSTEYTWKMDYLGYPLNRGKLTCQSCHDEVCSAELDLENQKFLRGGPYRNMDEFCYKCHIDVDSNFASPHNQIDKLGRVRENSCLFCHEGVPADSDDRENISLIGSELELCKPCHTITPHPGVNHMIRLPSDMMERKREYEKRHEAVFPLGENEQIQCSTCHNPHGKAVLKGEAAVGAGSQWRAGDFREVCAPCHGRY